MKIFYKIILYKITFNSEKYTIIITNNRSKKKRKFYPLKKWFQSLCKDFIKEKESSTNYFNHNFKFGQKKGKKNKNLYLWSHKKKEILTLIYTKNAKTLTQLLQIKYYIYLPNKVDLILIRKTLKCFNNHSIL